MRMGTMLLAATIVASGTVAAEAASIKKMVEVKAPAAKVWAMIGPFCSIQAWHPAIGKCTETGGVRTLVTKDGKGTFEEKQTADDAKSMMYSYAILKSPLPITGYKSTIKVTPKGADTSVVEWSSTFKPDAGKEKDAEAAIGGIYQSGLDNIQKMAAQ